MAPQRRSTSVALTFVLACCGLISLYHSSRALTSNFVVGMLPGGRSSTSMLSRRAFGGLGNMGNMFDPKMMEELTKNPEKMAQLQAEAAKLMENPDMRKQLEQFSGKMESVVKTLESDPDPEIQAFFKDIKTNGYSALPKYENNEAIMRKFSQASGGLSGMPGMPHMPGMPGMGNAQASPPVVAKYKPGDEVIVHGLQKAPELNGKKAMVVPPNAEEQKTLEGTDRMIIRLLDTGAQFAVKPSNLRTVSQEASRVVAQSLEDLSIHNDALQSEAAKLRESGKLDEIQKDPELKPIFEDIKKNGMVALEKYWYDEKLMKKINLAMR